MPSSKRRAGRQGESVAGSWRTTDLPQAHVPRGFPSARRPPLRRELRERAQASGAVPPLRTKRACPGCLGPDRRPSGRASERRIAPISSNEPDAFALGMRLRACTPALSKPDPARVFERYRVSISQSEPRCVRGEVRSRRARICDAEAGLPGDRHRAGRIHSRQGLGQFVFDEQNALQHGPFRAASARQHLSIRPSVRGERNGRSTRHRLNSKRAGHEIRWHPRVRSGHCGKALA